MARAGFIGILSMIAYSAGTFAQIITFNSPTPWLTLRSDSIVVKAQLDTAKFPKKKITLTASKIEGNKKKQIATKTFKVSDFTQDFTLGVAGVNLLGGKDFLKINWSVPGSKDSGFCAPVGIVNISKIAKTDSLRAVKSSVEVDIKNVAAAVSGAKFTKIKDREIALKWTPTALLIICKKIPASAAAGGAITFVFDGKNGKNAFTAFSDKMLDYLEGKDSIYSYINERDCSDSISYKQKPWISEIVKSSDKDNVVIRIPWYDIGIGKPFDGRIMGFSIFLVSDKAAVLAAYPDKAVVLIPGSWGNLVLDK